MSRTPATFKQSDVMRAVKAVRAAGLDVIETKIGPDGSIVMVHKTEGRSAAAPASVKPRRGLFYCSLLATPIFR